MRAITARYRKPDGREEVRTLFPEWMTGDNERFQDVSLFAHPCGHCVGGDHMHIEMHDTRVPLEVLCERELVLSEELRKTVDAVLCAKSAADRRTRAFAKALLVSA